MKLDENDLKTLIEMVIADGYGDGLPIRNQPDNLTIKSSDVYQMLQDMYAFNRFFEEIRPLMTTPENFKQLSPNFADKVRRLKRTVKILEKLI